jgi:DNA-binding NarL/FixJ family response regulator
LSTKKITVLIVDDHPLIREGLRMLLMAAGDIEVVGEAQDGREAILWAKKVHPDVVLMDLSMPVMNGIEATQQIHAQVPASKVLVLSSYGGDEKVIQCIGSGASGFLVKHSVVEHILNGIREVSRGRSYYDPSTLKRLGALNRGVPGDRLNHVSPVS